MKIPLREHFEALLAESDKRYTARFEAQEKAVYVALEQTKTRFENVNEWRGTVTDLLANAMPRQEAESRSTSTSEKIIQLQSRLDKLEGSGLGKHAMFGYFLAIVGLVGAAAALIAKMPG
jgi:hypothetical protein